MEIEVPEGSEVLEAEALEAPKLLPVDEVTGSVLSRAAEVPQASEGLEVSEVSEVLEVLEVLPVPEAAPALRTPQSEALQIHAVQVPEAPQALRTPQPVIPSLEFIEHAFQALKIVDPFKELDDFACLRLHEEEEEESLPMSSEFPILMSL